MMALCTESHYVVSFSTFLLDTWTQGFFCRKSLRHKNISVQVPNLDTNGRLGHKWAIQGQWAIWVNMDAKWTRWRLQTQMEMGEVEQ